MCYRNFWKVDKFLLINSKYLPTDNGIDGCSETRHWPNRSDCYIAIQPIEFALCFVFKPC